MATNYSQHISNKNTPQSQPLVGRTDMVQNNAGGYVFEITPQELLERFLLIGSEGGTYYASEQKLTIDNAKKIIDLIQINGPEVVNTIVTMIEEKRTLKPDPAIFVLSLVATYGDETAKKAAYDSITRVCKNSTQLFTFLGNIKNLRKWSAGLRKGVAKFYTNRSPEKLAYQLVKYRQRNGWTHRDALRLSHPKTENVELNTLFKYAVGKTTETGSELITGFEQAQTTTDVVKLTALIVGYGLTWEMIPTQFLNDKNVLTALLMNMPTMALVRNLNRLTKAGLTATGTRTLTIILDKLTSAKDLKESGIHPVFMLNAMKTYASGRGFKGTDSWTPTQKVVDAMQDAIEILTEEQESTGKRVLVAVDVSGSMNGPTVAGTSLSPKEAAAVLSRTMIKTEKNADLVWFDTQLYTPSLGRRNSIDEFLTKTPNGGGTDCALPLVFAAKMKFNYDAIIILTDSETWAGNQHGIKALEVYRKEVNPNVKVIEVAMVGNSYTQFPADEKNILKVVGFDASVIKLINSFVGRG